MIRDRLLALTLLFGVGLVPRALAATDSRSAASNPAAGPACLYESRSYSAGAYICVQKSLMLNCIADGERAAWKLVAEKELSERCVAPTALTVPPLPRSHVRRSAARRHRIEPAQEVSAKCFGFNGKRYCE